VALRAVGQEQAFADGMGLRIGGHAFRSCFM
jgi:hypothetical protein